jgi:hypothetical protein
VVVKSWGYHFFLDYTTYCGHLAMASKIPAVPNYVYIVIRLKISEEPNDLIGSGLFNHYGETNYVFLIGGLVQTGENLIACAIRHCRHPVNFRFT